MLSLPRQIDSEPVKLQVSFLPLNLLCFVPIWECFFVFPYKLISFADLIIIQNVKQFHLCSPQKLGQPVKLGEELFIETEVFGKYVSFLLEENVIARKEYGHLPSFLPARKESLVVRSEERQLYSQSRKVK